MQALYAFELGGGDIRHITQTLLKEPLGETPTMFRFAERLLIRAIDLEEEAEQIIADHTRNWDITRIALVDRLLLRLAITELLGFEDIPPKVSINEAIEISKRYSTNKSGRFINGILDAVLDTLKAEGRIRKSGRGLVGMDPPAAP